MKTECTCILYLFDVLSVYSTNKILNIISFFFFFFYNPRFFFKIVFERARDRNFVKTQVGKEIKRDK